MTDESTNPLKRIGSKCSGFISFMRHAENRSNATFALVAVLGFLVPWGFSKALDKTWEYFDPDDTQQQLVQLSQDAAGIRASVVDLKDSISNVKAEIPDEQYDAIMAMLGKIDASAAEIVPVVSNISANSRALFRGANLSEGPYVGQASFFMDAGVDDKGTTVQLCGNATLTYRPGSYSQLLLAQGGESRDGRLTSRPVRVGTITVTGSAPIDESKRVQIHYDCNAPAR